MEITGKGLEPSEEKDLTRLKQNTIEQLSWIDFAETGGLTAAEADELMDAFCLFDKDRSGTICVDELHKVMRALGQNPTQKELEEIMKAADLDHSGSLSYQEYANIIKSHCLNKNEVEIQLRQAFLVFDRDKTGTLSLDELRELLSGMGEPLSQKEVDYVLKKIDTNNDGEVDVEELITFLCEKVNV